MDYNKVTNKQWYKNREVDVKPEGLALTIDQTVDLITEQSTTNTEIVIEPLLNLTPESIIKKTMKVIPAMLNVRFSPSITSKVKTVLCRKMKVETEECDTPDWVKVSSKHGVSGFVLKRYLED